MEALNRAIDGAAAFKDMMRRVEGGVPDPEFERRLREHAQSGQSGECHAYAEVESLSRRSNENRAEHRARLKRERRGAKHEL